MKNVIMISVLFLFLGSCKKMVLGPDTVNDPENNFEIFWEDFDKHYALFGVRNHDWDSIYNAYEPKVTPQTTDEELWQYFTEMIEYLDDTHTFVYDEQKDTFFVSGNTLNAEAEEIFDYGLIEAKYVENITEIAEEFKFNYGNIVGKNIGYIYMENMTEEGFKVEIIDEVIASLKNYDAIILDLRNNGGGDDQFSERVAGVFADGAHFIYTVEERNGPNHDDFEEKKMYYTAKAGPEQYLKPVILLTDRYTVSAAEIFLLHMKAFGHVTQIGDSTSGDFSDTSMLRFLPNGWLYRYSIMKFLLPDGSSLDGIGHVPDVYVKNTKEEVEAGTDKVMETAFEYLFDTYGIK